MHDLDGCCPHLRLAVSDRVEDNSREYEYMVNVIDGTDCIEGSATESPSLATPGTASWEAQRLEWGIPAVDVVDDGVLTAGMVVAKGACVSVLKCRVLTIGLNQISTA